MQICIVGTGISGLAAASLLHAEHDITVLEAEDRVGGHSHTVDVLTEDGPVPVDTGFMVYNEINYPGLTRLLAHLGVATDPTDMSFSVSIGGGRLEYGCSSIRSLFAQPANLVSPSFLGMLRDIQRFNRVGRLFLDSGLEEALSLGGFLERQRLGRAFRHAYILPMAAAIWSAPPSAILDFPAYCFLRFFDNHGLLSINGHHRWRTVRGGSREYVRRLTAPFRHRIVTGASVRAVQRSDLGVHVHIEGGRTMRFDRVVLATHADQTTRMLVDADAEERRILGAFRYQPNTAFLHQDVRLMPQRRAAWASWNYLGPAMASSASPVSVTYWMNSL